MTALSLEIHVETRGNLCPDPEFDAMKVIFYSIFDDIPEDKGRRGITGVLIVDFESWSVVTDRNKADMNTPNKTESQKNMSTPSDVNCKKIDAKPTSSQLLTPSASTGRNKTLRKVDESEASTSKHAGNKSDQDLDAANKLIHKRMSALLERCGVDEIEVTYVQDELDLIHTFVDLVARYVCLKYFQKINKSVLIVFVLQGFTF